jgi:hypothetical protein
MTDLHIVTAELYNLHSKRVSSAEPAHLITINFYPLLT